MRFDFRNKTTPHPHSRYVCDDTHAQWKVEREYPRTVLTASQVPVLMGVNPYQTRDDLLRAKIVGDDFSGNASTWWGQHLETPIIQAAGLATGLSTIGLNRFYRRDDLGIAATIDGYIWDEKEVRFDACADGVRGPKTGAKGSNLTDDQLYDKSWFYDVRQCLLAHEKPMLIEAKNTAEFVGRKYSYRECPELYSYQVQAQMLVTGWEATLVACLVGGRDLRLWFVEADDDIQQAIILAAHAFAREVKEAGDHA